MRIILVLLVFSVSLLSFASVSFDVAPQITDDVVTIDYVGTILTDAPIYSLDHDFTVAKEHVPVVDIGANESTNYPKILVSTDHDYGLTLLEDAKGIKQYKRTWKTNQRTEAINYTTTEYSHRFYNFRDTGSYIAIV